MKQRHSGRNSIHSQSSTDGAVRSLEILRSNLQTIFDKEIDVVVKKYIETFFVPALKNIKENLGDNSVNDDQIRKVCYSLLDNSKSQYLSQANQSLSRANTPGMEVSDSDSSSNEVSTTKRKEPDSKNDNLTNKRLNSSETFQAPILSKTLLEPRPKPFIWNTSNITQDTSFILDLKASRALGLAENKERLSIKHPELIRYIMDNQDKEWLIQQKMISPLSRNGKFAVLVLGEVQRLAEYNLEYKNNPNIKFNDLQGFKLTDFIIKKMQRYFSEVNFKNHGTMENTEYSEDKLNGTSKPRSTLSSTHATLSALLSSHSDNSIESDA